ncbi:hypothetical protein SEA_TEMPO_48 [Microbacterium phage Tempo]|nr:hypothetical protein SEA_TEMPO_48 [Microbacterium phage Tempo]QKO02800.1 hypothetical protein SEA_KELCOLE_47 [Microbacterium phage Kelcole]UOW92793.1 hypothetical protein SEA_ROBINROSE_50 [Microbacterium phage RobinRose]WNT44259.1 hypothetical protein SEA_CANDC_47 [Microbacterium phage CandC]
MRCIICRLKPHVTVPVPALYVVFGLSLCTIHADKLALELSIGASVREVLRQAEAGEWD